jgi:hypothetical protein
MFSTLRGSKVTPEEAKAEDDDDDEKYPPEVRADRRYTGEHIILSSATFLLTSTHSPASRSWLQASRSTWISAR